MTRPLHADTSLALGKSDLPFAAIVYLDIKDDPLIAWTGIGDLPFAAGQTGDPSLDGRTFLGTGSLIEISAVSEGVGGSDALEITMPGVDPFQPMMRQLISDRRRWQFRRAVVWLMALHSETLAIAGKPFRIKTGRIDRMPYSEPSAKSGVVKCRIEGQQAYGNSALATRYSEQRDINPRDTSQTWVHSLANMSPEMGQKTAIATSNAGSSAGASGGFSGGNGGSFFTNRQLVD